MAKYIVPIKSCCDLIKTLFVLFNATAESVNCSLLKNLEKHFCNLTSPTKKLRQTLKIYCNIYRKKFIGNNLSITGR